jgi:hypothetical protein
MTMKTYPIIRGGNKAILISIPKEIAAKLEMVADGRITIEEIEGGFTVRPIKEIELSDVKLQSYKIGDQTVYSTRSLAEEMVKDWKVQISPKARELRDIHKELLLEKTPYYKEGVEQRNKIDYCVDKELLIKIVRSFRGYELLAKAYEKL